MTNEATNYVDKLEAGLLEALSSPTGQSYFKSGEAKQLVRNLCRLKLVAQNADNPKQTCDAISLATVVGGALSLLTGMPQLIELVIKEELPGRARDKKATEKIPEDAALLMAIEDAGERGGRRWKQYIKDVNGYFKLHLSSFGLTLRPKPKAGKKLQVDEVVLADEGRIRRAEEKSSRLKNEGFYPRRR